MSVEPTPALQRPHRSMPIRVFNAAGRLLRRCGWRRPLSADRILARARRRTGLSDFGELDVREPLGRLVEALERENRLTPLGRVLIHYGLSQLAEARLVVQESLRRHPDMLRERVVRPVFILGLPRTGTTLLHRLLAQDPAGRALSLWETTRPAPADARDRNNEIRQTRFHLAVVTRHLAPGLMAMHPVEAEAPEECSLLLMNTFRVLGNFGQYGHIGGFREWLDTLGPENTRLVYEEYHKQLQLLQWRCPPRHWVLKCPQHTLGLDALLRRFPDACVIQNHRPLAEVLPSACNLRLATMGMYADDPDPRRVATEACDYVTKRVLGPAARARGAHPGRVFDVSYRSLVRDPVAAVGAIYEHFGLRLGSEAEGRMRRWLAANPQGKHGRHRYSLEQFGLDRAAVDALFPGYPECFGVSAEPCRC
jgi:hypothetical protein